MKQANPSVPAINQAYIMNAIDDAEAQFDACFEILKTLRTGITEGLQILDFQPKLADALFTLMSVYRNVCAEEKSLIDRKNEMLKSDFIDTMKNIHKFKRILNETIDIGKVLGDSFAWLFYNENQEELYKHLNHQPTGLFVAGIGGLGEVEFIKKTPILYGCLVLYHGITSMLRVGDFTLYAFNHGVIASGELKTEKRGNDLEIKAYISSRYNLDENAFKPDNQAIDANVYQRDKLLRQLSAMDDLLKKQKIDHKVDCFRDNNVDFAFPEAPNKMSFKISKDNTLLTSILEIKESKLSERFFITDEGIDLGLDEAEPYAQSILVQGSNNNQFYMTNIDGKSYPTRVPLFWWNADIDFLKGIIFKKIIMMTVFNPAKFFDYYQDKGFEICNSSGPKNVSIEKEINGNRMAICNLYMFFDMICYSFMSVENILQIIDPMIEKSLEMGEQGGGRIDIAPHQRFR